MGHGLHDVGGVSSLHLGGQSSTEQYQQKLPASCAFIHISIYIYYIYIYYIYIYIIYVHIHIHMTLSMYGYMYVCIYID